MTSIHEMPFVRLVIPLGIGIVIADCYDLQLKYCLVPFGILLISLCVIYTYVRDYKCIQSSNILLILLLFLGGVSSMLYSNMLDEQQDIPKYTNLNFQGIVEDVKKSKDKRICILNVSKYFDNDLTYKTRFSVRLSIANSPKEILNGDQLIINGMLKPIFENKNPNTFNYKKYLAHKHVFHQLSVDAQAIVSQTQPDYISLLPVKSNNHAQTIFKKNLSPEAASIAIGMITGSKSDIPKDLLDTYSKVGVMHLLAVSGLHVGIISEALFFLFGQKKKRSKKTLSVLLIIIAIWLFVLFTGSSASTVRAGLMFTMLNLGRITDRLYNPFNAVACSAFILLVADPHYLFDLGFQLSYLAVTSIIFFYPIIKNFLDTSKSPWIIEKAWSLAVLSISANILILPLTVYYFNQVPIYFPITNILAVPAAGGIVIGGIGMLVFELIAPIINEYYSILYEFLIDCTNWFLKSMEQIPYASKEDITIDIPQVGMTYVIIITLMIMIVKNKIVYLKYCFIPIGILLFYSTIKTNTHSQESRFTIYNCFNKTAIDFTCGNETYTYLGDSLSQSFIDFNITPNRPPSTTTNLVEIAQLEEFKSSSIFKRKSLLVFANQLFFLPRSKSELENIPPETDFIILDHTHGLKSLNIGPNTLVILRNDKYLNNWNPDIPENQLIRIYKNGAFTKVLDDV